MNDACVTTLCLTSNFESWVLYKPSVSIAISFIMQNLCMYDLIQYFGKKKNLRIRKYYPSFTDDEFDVAKAIKR